MDERARAGVRSFGRVASEYARPRPAYPPEAVRWLVGETPSRVLDLGAGTGLFTEGLEAAGHRVLAADPSLPMLTQLVARLESPAVAATAEQVPVRDRVFDAVVAAQAFDWFEGDQALREIARVLRPGGVVGLVWNLRDESVPWVARLGTIIGAEPDPPAPGAALGLSGAFAPLETRRYRFWQRLDRQRLLDLVTSRSYVAVLAADRREEILDNVSQLYDAYRGDALGLQMPYETLCFRAVRT